MDLGHSLTANSREQLLDILDECGHKSLIIDKDISPLVSAICPFSLLQSHGVNQVHWLSDDLLPIEGNVIYLSRVTPKALKLVAGHAKSCLSTGNSTLRLIAVPVGGLLTEWLLEEAEILGDITIYSWNAQMALMGPNLCLFSDGENDEAMSAAATALTDLQYNFGTFGRISGFGSRSKQIYNLILEGAGEKQSDDAVNGGGYNYEFGNTFVGSHIDHLIIIDRNVDRVTPLLSQLTYQGLIDDTFGIVSPGIATLNGGQKVKLSDNLFESLADLNFGEVGQELNSKARQLQAEIDATHNAQSVSEIKDYVSKKLEGHQILKQNLKVHTGITESLMNHVNTRVFDDALTLQQSLLNNQLSTWDAVTSLQKLIYQGCSVQVSLQILCLICLCRNGVKEKYLHMLYDDILRRFGFEYLQTIQELEREQMIFSKSDNSTFSSVARAFKLNSEERLSEAYAGYVPLTTRLVQSMLNGTAIDSRIVGPHFDFVQKSDNAREAKLRRILLRNTPGRENPVVMVMIIGGTTYSEAASIRALEDVLDTPVSLLVATTAMIKGTDMVRG